MPDSPVRNHYWQTPYVEWHKEVPLDWDLLVFYMRTSRQRARVVAVVEALRMLRDVGVVALVGGPFADRKGVFWIAAPPATIDVLGKRLPLLGYTCAAEVLRDGAASLGLQCCLDAAVDRKGLNVTILAWDKIPAQHAALPAGKHHIDA